MDDDVYIKADSKQSVDFSPIDQASSFSKMFYTWLNPVFSASRQHPLTINDIYNRPSRESTKLVTEKLQKEWEKQKRKRRPSFLRAFYLCHIFNLLLTGLSLSAEVACVSVRPHLMNEILTGFEDMSIDENRIRAGIACIFLLTTTLMSLFLRNFTFWMTYKMGMRARVSACGLIYKKVLRLNQKALSGTTAGQIINLISTDSQRFELSFLFIHFGWIGPLQAIFVFWLMGEIAPYPTIAAASVMIFFIPMQSLMNQTYAKLRIKITKITDSRIRILSDLINGIKIIKLHTWEPFFSDFVQQIRKKETRKFMLVRLCQAFQFTQLVYQVKLTTMAMLLTMVLSNKSSGDPSALASNQMYTLLNYLNALFLCLTLFLPMCIQYLFDTEVSCTRIQRFLELDEIGDENVPEVVESSEPKISLNNVTAAWSRFNSKPTLRDLSLSIQGPKLVAVVGAVGSGKSSLLQVILGELPHAEGTVIRSSAFAYMSQIPWIFPGTIRDNVLCSLPFDLDRYNKVLRATTLDVDIANLIHGDQTQVGERGVSLSGGQRARVGLARVAYGYSRCVLLDDPLAAVDARVSKHLFKKCICGVLSDRLRILVTHQHQFLTQVDMIVVMEEGRISHCGTYGELVSQGINFHEYELDEQQEATKNKMDESEVLYGQLMEDDTVNSTFRRHTSMRHLPSTHADETIALRRNAGRAIILSSDNLSVHPKPSFLPNCSLRRPVDYAKALRRHSSQTISGATHSSRLAFSVENVMASGLIHMNDEPDEDASEYALPDIMEEIAGDMDEQLEEEQFRRGSVSWKYYLILGRIGGGLCGVFATLLLFVITITTYAGCDVWLAKWTEIVDERHRLNVTYNASGSIQWDMQNNYFNVIIYSSLAVFLVIISSIRSAAFFAVLINSAGRLHNGMLRACLNTRIKFFESNTSGRILNRFSKDIGQLDDYLPTNIHDFLQCFFLVLSIVIVTVISSYWIVIPLVPLLILFFVTRRYYIFTSRDLKRIEAVARSPVFSWVSVTIQGLPCIRAARNESYQLEQYERLQDVHTSVFYMSMAAARWLSVRLDLVCFGFIGAVVVACLLLGMFSSVSSAEVGLMITYATGLVGLFQWCVRQSAEVENQMVSVERAVEYMDLKPEVSRPPVIEPPKRWPDRGQIIFEHLYLRYSETAPWVLNDINLTIEPGTKVGIVGRTGAGKSSLISALFRLVEAEQGRLLVDGVDIAHLDLRDLRKNISIIPQDPIMFAGTIRSNMDPHGQLDDSAIWDALNSVQLGRMISDLRTGLNSPISEGGSNFSTGQRQLLALARAILGGNRILVIDEATANVDPITDGVIQKTLRNQFTSYTVLTVAHRLQTVIDNDMLVVMENGRIVEHGHPHVLLNPELAEADKSAPNPSLVQSDIPDESVTGSGPLANLVLQTGPKSARLLAQMARKAYLKWLTHPGMTHLNDISKL